MSGVFVTFEGIEGSGKTTAAEWLAGELRAQGRRVTLSREPGGTAIGEQVRAMLLGNDTGEMTAETEALLFAASRAQLMSEVIRPALNRGEIVIVDRFTDSSLAYQWGGRGLPLDALKTVQLLATGGVQPDLKLLLDLPVAIGLRRRFASHGETNRMDREAVAFHERVRTAYHALVAADPEHWRTIDATGPEDDVLLEVWNAVSVIGQVESGMATVACESLRGPMS